MVCLEISERTKAHKGAGCVLQGPHRIWDAVAIDYRYHTAAWLDSLFVNAGLYRGSVVPANDRLNAGDERQ